MPKAKVFNLDDSHVRGSMIAMRGWFTNEISGYTFPRADFEVAAYD